MYVSCVSNKVLLSVQTKWTGKNIPQLAIATMHCFKKKKSFTKRTKTQGVCNTSRTKFPDFSRTWRSSYKVCAFQIWTTLGMYSILRQQSQMLLAQWHLNEILLAASVGLSSNWKVFSIFHDFSTFPQPAHALPDTTDQNQSFRGTVLSTISHLRP